MPQSMRMHAMAALVLTACSAVMACAVEHKGVDQLKLSMAQSVIDGRHGMDAVSLNAAVGRANAMTGVHIDTTAARPTISLLLDKPCAFEASLSNDGDAITVVVPNAIPLPTMEKMILDGGRIVSGVKVHLNETTPQFSTIFEISLSTPVTFASVARGAEIVLTLSPKGATPSLTELSREILADIDHQKSLSKIAVEAFEESRQRFADRAGQLGVDILPALVAAASPGVDVLARQLEEIAGTSSLLVHSEKDPGYISEIATLDSTLSAQLSEIAASIQQRNKLKKEIVEGFVAANSAAAMESLSRLHAEVRADGIVDQRRYQDIERQYLDFIESTLDAMRSQSGSDNNHGIAQLEAALGALEVGPDGTEATGRLAELSSALVAVRQAEISTKLSDMPPVAVIDAAAISTSDLPPAKRADPSYHSTGAENGYPTTGKLFSVNAGAMDTGSDYNGVIVLAQNPAEPAEAETVEATGAESPETPADTSNSEEALQRLTIGAPRASEASVLINEDLSPEEDPLRQVVDLVFVDMPLKTVVEILALKGQINVIAGDLSGKITTNLQGIPLGRGIEIVLRQENLGIIEEEGVYRITSYEEAVASRRETELVFLKKASALEVKDTIDQVISGSSGTAALSVAANESTNLIILSGPREMVQEYSKVIRDLDVADEKIPTETLAIKLNYSEVEDMLGIVQELVSEIGKVSGDVRGRQLILTDLPIKVSEITDIVKQLDLPVKQVSIEAMIIDALMADDAETGIDWITRAVRRTSRNGENVGNLAGLTGVSDFTTGSVSAGVVPALNLGGQIAFQILSGDIDISAVIGGEVRSDNAELIANPSLVTVENKLARITIAEEIPFQELVQTGTGQPIAATEFKEVGTVLEVTPRVTHDNHVLVALFAKQSDTKGESVTGIPPEDKREVSTELRVADGQTIYIGGLRRFDDELSNRKTPILGDLPVLGLLFKSQSVVKEHLELLLFLTCHVLPDDMPDVTPSQKRRYDELGGLGDKDVNATKVIVDNYIHPERDPIYKWKRPK